ncbi:acyl-CoA thioesterase [Candidatus Sulfurimonas marisnigri]|uniref:Acyl-CoA thioesterase n=1 Tax=Candidatus Sulfurimonas marisnigri TaxID=2740405 RepID=A0A7S7M104_9BACT|nr:acyl-CoA thioesterase [Candidatus Sulfurimonas marisnigri]QOY55146.1 acyl-CoA thioesterase [Candidatus Sulfurimonas marisnigri]
MKQISLRGRAYPSDLNHSGTVFGGWIMAKMDKAASIAVEDIVNSGAVTISVTDLHFLKPIRNGDIVTIYTEIIKVGNTSIQINVNVMVRCKQSHEEYSVTNAIFTFVTLNEDRKPINVRDVIRDDINDYVKELL